MAQRSRLGIRHVLLLAGVGLLQDIQSLSVGGHHTVLNTVVHHFYEMAGAVRPAVQITLFGRPTDLFTPRCTRISPIPGANVAKMGSRCLTALGSPPIIMQ